MPKESQRKSKRLAENGTGSDASAAARIAASTAKLNLIAAGGRNEAIVIKPVEVPIARAEERVEAVAGKSDAAGEVAEGVTVVGGEVRLESPSDTSGIRVVLSADDLAHLKSMRGARSKRGLNMFHEQFAGINQFPLDLLKVFAETELKRVADWDEDKE